MTDQETLYMMALAQVPSVSQTNLHLLIDELGTATAIYEKRGETCPAIPKDAWAEEGYAVTARELKALCGK